MKKIYALAALVLGLSLSSPEASAAAPSPGDFDGHYLFQSDMSLAPTAKDDYLTSDFVFGIETTVSNPGTDNEISTIIITDFFYEGNRFSTDYDQETGRLYINVLYFRSLLKASQYIGIAPVDGGWNGFSALTGNRLYLQIEENGTITIPDFDLITFNGATKTGLIAEYRNITVEPTTVDPVGPEPVKSFEGRYYFTGKKSVYSNCTASLGHDCHPVLEGTSDFDFDLVINEKNQIISIANYTLTADQQNVNRNQGEVKGNTLVFTTSSSLGVEWAYLEESTEVLLIGNGYIGNWIQDTQIVFTLNDDGSYALTPFTIWKRTIEEIQGSDPDGQMGGGDAPMNQQRQFTLQFKWEGQGANGGDNPDSSVGSLEIDSSANAAVYYNLQGIRVDNPTNGIFIRVQDGKTSKIIR